MINIWTDPPGRRGFARWAIILIVAVVAFAAGWLLRPAGGDAPAPTTRPATRQAETGKPQLYVCSMNISYHPYFSSTDPNTPCGYCGMKLIPASEAQAAGDPTRTVVSETAAKLLDIETTSVERRFPIADVQMLGGIDYDETTLKHITAWVGGRIERMFVDYTGVAVRKGDHMVELYSSELLSAQSELLEAIKAADNLAESTDTLVRQRSASTIAIARDRLRLWGLTDEQIADIEARGVPRDQITIYAPAGGIVIDKGAQQGQYVKVGTRIYTIADLSRLWVILDAYESDLTWLRVGQEVEFTSVATPGERFGGTISFISPVLDEKSRTVKVRINVANDQGKLKPGMFVKATVRARLAADGRVMIRSLADKYLCPMHPEIVSTTPGNCVRCGMPLVTAESLGLEPVDEQARPPLVLPASAVLWTGVRAVTYVKVPDQPAPTFQWREITLGARAGEEYIVREGLKEGEQVVTRGAFAIDSERQLKAAPNMLSSAPEGPSAGHAGHAHMGHGTRATPDQTKRSSGHSGHSPMGHEPPDKPKAAKETSELTEALQPVFNGYFMMQTALATDDLATAKLAAEMIAKAVAGTPDPRLREHVDAIKGHVTTIAAAADLAAARAAFEPLSARMLTLVRQFGPPGRSVYLLSCPMAFDNRGAEWLQLDKETRNPYFGATMLRCGVIKESFEVGKDTAHD